MCCSSCHVACPEATGNLKVREEMGGVREGAAESLEGALVSDHPPDVAALSIHSPRTHSKKTLLYSDLYLIASLSLVLVQKKKSFSQ